ncbi:PREDICTED: uncharacterized protein LOC104800710 [Tarenaya hassleriana]|uniref:uncharacterized protein LOC104800710 n=1 Tax=Tarenaya hassleriana TaxID=28532 RepID=UPI00053C0ABE|nr:PREDICTED: uncharacterized protein LOC104800710 [Tarenaya hassleriana]XP_010521906.1 PREDICTED: uncharacterized protein LOC104800710 [Tarenaya hassleriana]
MLPMECGVEVKKGPSVRPPFVASEKKVMIRETQKTSPQEKLQGDRRGLSYSDFHREVTKNVEDVYPKRLENRLKPRIGRTASGEREIVKYKSYVPNYIKKGEKLLEKDVKSGSIGLLDVNKNTGSSVSSTSSSLWTDESSNDSSRGMSVSSSHKRMNNPPLQFYLMSSKPGNCPQVSRPSEEANETLETDSALKENTTKECGASIGGDGCFQQSPSGAVLQQHEKEKSDYKTVPTSGTFSNLSKPNIPPCTRVIPKTQADDPKKKGEKLDDRIRNSRVHDLFGKEKTAPVFVPGIVPQKQFIGLSKFYDTKVFLAERVAETDRKGVPGRSVYRQGGVLDSGASLSCPSPREADNNKPFLKRISFMSLEKNKFSSERSRSAPRSTKAESSPTRGRTLDRRSAVTPSKQSDQGSAKVLSERARSISPFRRLSFSIGKSIKGSDPKDAHTPPHSCTTNISSRPSSEDPSCSSFSGSSSFDKTSSTRRGRSSPLRRLLDPLIKPKTSNSCKSPEPSQRAAYQKHIFSDSQPSSSTFLSRNGKLSTVQALFRVTSKNDQPLFTFAVDKEQNITAATIRKQNSLEKDGSGYKYTFFAVQEVKKKSGKWINHGSKCQSQEYTSNIVAQMRASGSQSSIPTGGDCFDQFMTREFVLFSSESQRTNELAAIVVKIPTAVDRNSSNDLCQDQTLGETQRSTTVILPSGIHSLPHRGGPSSLIQRWKSGGACDCGGWDMGCNLRILTSQNQPSKPSCSSEPPSTSDGFKLFFQGGVSDNRPFLRFTTYKDGVYAVEYNSSLSLLQAFSICIAVNDGRNFSGTLEPNSSQKEKSSSETPPILNERLKSFSGHLDGDSPARYLSFRPLSPVGRV